MLSSFLCLLLKCNTLIDHSPPQFHIYCCPLLLDISNYIHCCCMKWLPSVYILQQQPLLTPSTWSTLVPTIPICVLPPLKVSDTKNLHYKSLYFILCLWKFWILNFQKRELCFVQMTFLGVFLLRIKSVWISWCYFSWMSNQFGSTPLAKMIDINSFTKCKSSNQV